MSFFHANDAISGKEGRAYAVINGRVEERFYCKDLEATAELKESDFNALGTRGTQTKITGWTGAGNMTIYYATSLFRMIVLEYIKTGKMTYFDIQVVNEDPSSSLGKQTTILKNVTLSKVTMAKLDVEADFLDETVDFKYSDVDVLDQFGQPVLG